MSAPKVCRQCGAPRERGKQLCWPCKAANDKANKLRYSRAKREVRTCWYCDAVVGPRRRTCDACQLERRRKYGREWNQRPDIKAKRKTYESASSEKRRAAYARRRKAQDAQRRAEIRERQREAGRRYIASEKGKAARARYTAKLRADPERYAALQAHWRAAYAARRAKPGTAAADNESARLAARLRAERNGHPVPPVTEPPPDPGGSRNCHRHLDVTQLLPYIEHYLQFSDEGAKALATAATVSERRLWEITHRRSKYVHYAVADRLAVAMGLTLSLIYPEDS